MLLRLPRGSVRPRHLLRCLSGTADQSPSSTTPTTLPTLPSTDEANDVTKTATEMVQEMMTQKIRIPPAPQAYGMQSLKFQEGSLRIPPVTHISPSKDSTLVASLTLQGYMPDHLELAAYFARHSASTMAMASDPVIHAPLDTSRWSTLVSPFVHAKTKEIFERTTHGRILQVYDGTPETVKDWVNYVVKNMPPGIKVSVQSFSWAPLGHRVSEPPRQVTTPAVRIPEPSPASVVDVDGEQVDVSASNESSPVSTVVDGEQVGVSASTESSPSTVVDGKQVDISSEPSSAADSSTSAKATANPPTPDEAFEELVRAKTRAFLEAFGHIPKTGGAEKQSSKV